MATVRVVVGDDHPLYRQGVVQALVSSGSVEVVGEAQDGASALQLIRDRRPEVAVLDYRMPGLDGAQVAAAVLRDGLPTRVLLLSAHDESAMVYHALTEGAAGYLSKESTDAELVSAVHSCAAGRDVLPSAVAAGLVGEIRRREESRGVGLSPREREILRLMADGHTLAAIAAQIHVAQSTVKTHVQRIYEKLDVNGRGAAIAEAMRRNLMD